MIRIGVIGYGYWGPNLVRNFAELDRCRVTAVCDLDPARLGQAARRHPGIATTPDARELIGRADVDAVVIATPVSTHYGLARAALETGRHVLVEKPLASSSYEAQALIDLAAARRLVVMVDHTFVYTGAVRRIRDLVAGGDVGDVYYYDSVRVNLGLFQNDVDVLWDLAVHDLSIMDFVLGRHPVAVSATGLAHVAGSPANIAYLSMFFDAPLIAHVHVNWLAPVKIRQTLIGGSRRMIVYDDLEPSDKVRVYDRGISLDPGPESVYAMKIGYRAGDMWAPRIELGEALHAEARHFLDCIESGRTPETPGEAGLRIIRVLEAASASLQDKGRLVTVARSVHV